MPASDLTILAVVTDFNNGVETRELYFPKGCMFPAYENIV